MRRRVAGALFTALALVAVGRGGVAGGQAPCTVDLGVDGVSDGVADEFTVVGSPAGDAIAVTGSTDTVTIVGIGPPVLLTGFDPFDTLVVDTGGGADLVDATGLDGRAMHLDVRAGSGDDGVLGSPGTDAVHGGSGADLVAGGDGADTVWLDEGADEVVWTAGGGPDVIDGGGGVDTLTTLRADLGQPTTVGEWRSWADGPWTHGVELRDQQLLGHE